MLSPPPLTHEELQGSSRTTGGLFRGRAYGNNPNAADLRENEDELIPVTGRVHLYVTQDDPADWDLAVMNRQVFNHSVTTSLAEVLQVIGDLQSPIRRKFYF